MFQLSKTAKGFTLIELMVVVSIIGMLTAAIAVNSNAARIQSRDAKRKTDVSLVSGALEVYYSEKRVYPDIESFAGSWDALKTVLYPTYLSVWPTDPIGPDGAFGSGFVYASNPAGSPNGAKVGSYYVIDVRLEGKEAETAPTIQCGSSGDINFYLSGTKICTGSAGNALHYRTSTR